MAERSNKSSDKARRKKTLIYTAIGAGVFIAGGAAYLWLTREKPIRDTMPESWQPETASQEQGQSAPSTPSLPPPRTGFPLQKGSRGQLVKDLQAMLNSRHRSGLVVDGDWGSRTEAALVKAGLPTVIDAATYSRLVGEPPTAQTASEVVANWQGSAAELATKAAQGIAYWVNARDAQGVLTFVTAMRSVTDYSAVNTVFKTIPTANRLGTKARRTLVTALVGDDMPWTSGQKARFAQEFLRMGLKHNSSTDTWTLSGLGQGLPPVRTLAPVSAWDASGIPRHFPAGSRVGVAVGTSGGVSQVLTPSGETLFIPANALAQVIL
jgi:hypothetical protein